MPALTPVSRVTVIAESVLESKLIYNFLKLGAKGWSAMDCRGAGERHLVQAVLDAGAKSRIEVIVKPAVADKIIAYLEEEIFPSYAVVATVEDVKIVRPERF